MSNELKEALANIDLKGAMRSAFGKCPEHNVRLVAGHWLKWCPRKDCTWHAPK